MRVSYNGYYVAFPRPRRGFDSRHPHHCDSLNPSLDREFLFIYPWFGYNLLP